MFIIELYSRAMYIFVKERFTSCKDGDVTWCVDPMHVNSALPTVCYCHVHRWTLGQAGVASCYPTVHYFNTGRDRSN